LGIRPLTDPVVEDDSAWPEIEACVGRAVRPIEVLAVDRQRSARPVRTSRWWPPTTPRGSWPWA